MDPDDTDPGGPPDILLDLAPSEEPDPSEIPGAELDDGFEEGRTEEGPGQNANPLGGVITVIIFIGLFIAFRGIMSGSLALMVASAVVTIVIPVLLFVGVTAWRAGSAPKETNTKKGEK